jgi:hypothetical protein
MPSGHARHNRGNSGEEFLPCLRTMFPTILHKPYLSTVLTAPVKTKRSPLDVKGPAHAWLSHQAAQPYRLLVKSMQFIEDKMHSVHLLFPTIERGELLPVL